MTEMTIDLAALDTTKLAEKGGVLELRHPATHQQLDVKIWLQGIDAPTYRTLVRQQIDEQIAMAKTDLSAAEMEARHIKRLVTVTLKWENITYQGAELIFTEENAEKLYREQFWIREQVSRFMEDRSHFLPT